MKGMSRPRLIAVAGLIAGTALLGACKRDTPSPSADAAAPAPKPTPAPAAATTPPAAAEAPDQALLQRIAKEVMNQQYGDNYDAANRCWRFSADFGDNGGSDYCMRPGAAHVVEVEGQRQVYLSAANAFDIKQPEYLYSHVEPGLMGAFQLALAADGSWRLLAGDKALTYGTNGSCSCEDAKLIRIGAQRYGWTFSSGGVWQGIVVTSHSLIAPVGRSMLDLSRIPHVNENDQDSEYAFTVDASDPTLPFYPLIVSKSGGADGVQRFRVAFDPAQNHYQLPEDAVAKKTPPADERAD